MDASLVAVGDVVDQPLGVRVGRPPTGQYELACPELGQIRRRVQTDRTQAAGDQVAPIGLGLQRVRHLHDDLADVPRLLHAPECGPGLGERVDLRGQRRPLALGQALRHLGEQVANAIGFGEHHRVQRDDLVGDVGTGRRHLLR